MIPHKSELLVIQLHNTASRHHRSKLFFIRVGNRLMHQIIDSAAMDKNRNTELLKKAVIFWHT